jgi:uroporphyrinogen decarboxylase
LPGIEADHADDVAEMNVRFPSDFLHLDTKWPAGKRTKGQSNRPGHYTDAWGCTWQLGHRGAAGPLVASPLADAERIAAYEPPLELLEPARAARAVKGFEGSSRFILAWSDVRPLERMQALCGPEAAVTDLSGGHGELRRLLGRLHEFFCREIELWAGADVDGVVLGDTLTTPEGLRLALRTWRSLLRPLFRQYCEMLHARDKLAFFSSGSRIDDVFGDLVEAGFDSIHAPFFQMDFEKLAEKYRGRVTFWGGIDRKWLDPPATYDDIREAVLRVRRAADFGAGGVIAQCAWDPESSLRNLAKFFEEWMIPMPVTV